MCPCVAYIRNEKHQIEIQILCRKHYQYHKTNPRTAIVGLERGVTASSARGWPRARIVIASPVGRFLTATPTRGLVELVGAELGTFQSVTREALRRVKNTMLVRGWPRTSHACVSSSRLTLGES
jgi:hypothetical protein